MFEIKICGVRLKSDIVAVAQATKRSGKAVAVGLNFFPPSIRYVDPADTSTRQLSDHARQLGLIRVGVFVNETVATMQQIAAAVGLDAVQLHGDEPIDVAKQLIADGHRVVRAIKLPTTDLTAEQIQQRVEPWAEIGCHPLLDADAGAAHGGSGKTLQWDVIAEWSAKCPDQGWTLAGGLNPENLAAAISRSTAQSVDTASGAEAERGVKSPARIGKFFEQWK